MESYFRKGTIKQGTSQAPNQLFSGRPHDSVDEGVQEDLVGKGIVGVPVSRSENASFAILVCPENGMVVLIHIAFRSSENRGVGPDLFDDVKFVHRGGVAFRNGLHDRMIFFGNGHWIAGLVVVFAACDTKEFSPIIDFGRAVRVHCTVDDYGINPFEVRFRDTANIGFVVRVCEAFVMDDNVKSFEPFRVFVKVDHGLGPFTTLVDDCPVDWDTFLLGRQLHCFSLEFVIVAAATRYQQHGQVLLGRCGTGGYNWLLR